DRPAREHGDRRPEDGARDDDGPHQGRPAAHRRGRNRRGEAALPVARDRLRAGRRDPRPPRAGPRRRPRPDRLPAARGRRRGMRHNRRVTSDEIRETFLSYFEQRGHRRMPSASLVPATFDPSVLLTTAGMHPLKPYFSGIEAPPRNRLTSCQQCFRSTDIENVGNTARHLTFFEMLGNFSIGDYFWQSGPTGPCGPCSELYLDRGPDWGADDERPGDDTERYLEFWNLVFMTYDLGADGSLTELPMRNIDTGMGLDRMAAILQGVTSVYETDLVRPLLDLAEEMSGRSYAD